MDVESIKIVTEAMQHLGQDAKHAFIAWLVVVCITKAMTVGGLTFFGVYAVRVAFRAICHVSGVAQLCNAAGFRYETITMAQWSKLIDRVKNDESHE